MAFRVPDPSPRELPASCPSWASRRRSDQADSRHPAAAGTCPAPRATACRRTIAGSVTGVTGPKSRAGRRSANRRRASPTVSGGPWRVLRSPGQRRRVHRPRRCPGRDRALHAAFVEIFDRADFVSGEGAAALQHQPELLFRGLVAVLPFCRVVRELCASTGTLDTGKVIGIPLSKSADGWREPPPGGSAVEGLARDPHQLGAVTRGRASV